MSSARVRYRTLEIGSMDIHLRTLRDSQQFSDDEGIADALGISSANWSLFGVVWASGRTLAELMSREEIAGKRILEVGCGIALASLVLNGREADITATDYHPEAGDFLRENVRINHGRPIPFVRAGWTDADCGIGLFDLVIASDVLYERGHVEQLAAFIGRHAGLRSEVVVVDPGRGHLARFGKCMAGLGYSPAESRPPATAFFADSARCRILRCQRG